MEGEDVQSFIERRHQSMHHAFGNLSCCGHVLHTRYML